MRIREKRDQFELEQEFKPENTKKVTGKNKKIKEQESNILKDEVQKPAKNKNSLLAAKKISKKHKKLRVKKLNDLADFADAESALYEQVNLKDASSKKSAGTTARKISKKYEKLRAKKLVPFALEEIADADTVNHGDIPNPADANLNLNTRISEKKKKLVRN